MSCGCLVLFCIVVVLSCVCLILSCSFLVLWLSCLVVVLSCLVVVLSCLVWSYLVTITEQKRMYESTSCFRSCRKNENKRGESKSTWPVRSGWHRSFMIICVYTTRSSPSEIRFVLRKKVSMQRLVKVLIDVCRFVMRCQLLHQRSP